MLELLNRGFLNAELLNAKPLLNAEPLNASRC
jgi:hypothetical protein